MSRWIAYRITATHMGGAGVSLEKLGGLNAPHHPAAVFKAQKKWPDVPHDKLHVRMPQGKTLLALARARRANAALRKAYQEGDKQ